MKMHLTADSSAEEQAYDQLDNVDPLCICFM